MKLTDVLREECVVAGGAFKDKGQLLRRIAQLEKKPDSYTHRAEKSGRNTGGLAGSLFLVIASCEYQ